MSKTNHKLKEFVGAAISRPHFEGISKKERGITLIALIITIVVMLILVAVTLDITLGENGLVNKAKTASEATTKAMEQEMLLTAAVGALGTDGKVDFTELDSNLPKGFTGSNGNYISKNGNTFTVAANGTVTMQGGISGGTPVEGTLLTTMYKAGLNCTEENCKNPDHLHVGDYVNYKPDTVSVHYPDGETIGSKTGYTAEAALEENGVTATLQEMSQETLNWRVLGYNETNDQVLLISGAPTNETVTFYGHVGWNNYEEIVTNACGSLYSKSGIGTARSIEMNDIKTYLGSTFDETTFDEDGIKYGDTHTFTSQFNYENEKFTKLPEGTTTDVTLTLNGYYYMAEEYITDSVKLELLQGENNEYYYLMNGKAFFGDYICVEVFEGGTIANIGYLFYLSGDEHVQTDVIRPVIELNTNTTRYDIQKIDKPESETWNDPLGWN